jgi:hypothetical protein
VREKVGKEMETKNVYFRWWVFLSGDVA